MSSLRKFFKKSTRRNSPRRTASPGRSATSTESKSSPPKSPRKSPRNSPRKSPRTPGGSRIESKYDRNDDVDNLIAELSSPGSGGYRGVASIIGKYADSDEDFYYAAINEDNATVSRLINIVSEDIIIESLKAVIKEFEEGNEVPFLNLIDYERVISVFMDDPELSKMVYDTINELPVDNQRIIIRKIKDTIKKIEESRITESKYDRNDEVDDLIAEIISPGNPRIGYGGVAAIIHGYSDIDETFLDAIKDHKEDISKEDTVRELINDVSKDAIIKGLNEAAYWYSDLFIILMENDRVLSIVSDMKYEKENQELYDRILRLLYDDQRYEIKKILRKLLQKINKEEEKKDKDENKCNIM